MDNVQQQAHLKARILFLLNKFRKKKKTKEMHFCCRYGIFYEHKLT